jgi:hypothetical protein
MGDGTDDEDNDFVAGAYDDDDDDDDEEEGVYVRAKRARRGARTPEKTICGRSGLQEGLHPTSPLRGPRAKGFTGGGSPPDNPLACRSWAREGACASAAEAGCRRGRRGSFAAGAGCFARGLSGGDPPNPPCGRRGRT